MPIDLQPVEFFMQEKELCEMKYSGNINYSKHIMIGPMPPEPVHFISTIPSVLTESNSIFFFNLRGKPKFVFHFGAIVIIILAQERKSSPTQTQEGEMYLFWWIGSVLYILDEARKHVKFNIICQNSRNFMLMVKCFCFHRILNKLTPDKFEKLCHELLSVGIETKYILKGVILLVSWT